MNGWPFASRDILAVAGREAGLVAGVLGAWLALLALAGKAPPAGLGLLLGEAVAVLAGLRWLAAPAERGTVMRLFLAALALYTLEVLAVQATPQWLNDSAFDSARYDLNARALVRHWQGLAVPAAEFKLTGLVRNGIAAWLPGDSLPYREVLGMGRYLYQLGLAVVYALADGSRTTAVFANLPCAAALVPGAYLLALALFARRRTAFLAAGLVLLDSNFAVWSSLLMRDIGVALGALLALLGCVRGWRGEDRRTAGVLAVGAMAALFFLRFNVVAALVVAGLAAAVPGLRLEHCRKAGPVLAGVALLGGILLAVPAVREGWQQTLPGRVVGENLQILKSAGLVADAAAGGGVGGHDVAVDAVRRDWHARLREQPWWLNAIRAAARTLMGPYPWVAFTQGVSGTNFYELMYPGMALWVACLPWFGRGLWLAGVRADPAVRWCLVWLAVEAGIYIVGYGEFSGRERLMAQPLLWLWVARGMTAGRAETAG